MTTQPVLNPSLTCTVLHNTRQWQVTEHMGGYAAEILFKTRDISATEQKEAGLKLHECYPSVFLQGDEATNFLEELRKAQEKLKPAQIDSLVLDPYSVLMH